MDNSIHELCPSCKIPGITNWFDETKFEDHNDELTEVEDEL